MPLNPTQPGMAAGRCSGWRQGYYGRSATLAVAPHAGLVALALERIRLIALPGPFRAAGPARLTGFDADVLRDRLALATVRACAMGRHPAALHVMTARVGLLPRSACSARLAAAVIVRCAADRGEGLERF